MDKSYIDVTEGDDVPLPQPNTLRSPNLFKIPYSTKFPYRDPITQQIKYRINKVFMIVRANNENHAENLFNEYSKGKDWIIDIGNCEPIDLLVDSSITNDQSSQMSIITFIHHVENNVKCYIKIAKESVFRNKHMNELKNINGLDNLDQKIIDALFVDFINFVALKKGVDYAMYTKDLKNKLKS